MRTAGYNSVNSWLAAFATAILGFLITIPSRLSGLFYVYFLERYDTDRKMATVPIVIFNIMRSLFGVFIGVWGEIFGFQAVILVGCILATIGVGCSFFAEDITTVIICFGVIYGVGFALANSLVHSVLRQHFTKNINLANGIYFTGSCIGASIMAPLVEYLNNQYGFSGMVLILSGIFLHSLPACIFFKDPKNEECGQHNKVKNIEANQLQNLSASEDIEHSNVFPLMIKDESEKNQTYSQIGKTKLTVKHRSLQNSRSEILRQTFMLFADPTFFLTMLIHSTHAVIFILNWTVVVDFGRDKGIPYDNCVYFVMFLPVAEIVGNLGLNWITDLGIMSRTNYCIICLIFLGVDSGFIVWTNDFVVMVICVVIFGIVSGTLSTTFPGMLMEFIRKEQQNVALASRFTLYAVLNLCVTPMVGYFRGQLGHYDGVYYIMMIACFCCCILVKLTPTLASCRDKKDFEANKINKCGEEKA